MRIAFIAQRMVYPPDAGTPIRNLNLAVQAAANHHLTVYAYSEESLRPTPLEDAGVDLRLLPAPPPRSRARRLLDLLTSAEPDMARRSRSLPLLRLLEDDLPRLQPEIVQIQALDMAYVLPTVRSAVGRAKVVLDQHNAEYVLQQRALSVDRRRPRRWPAALYSSVQSGRLRRYERAVCQACDTVLTVSDEDADALRRLGIETPIEIVPNGVDLSEYKAIPQSEALAQRKGPNYVFPGKMDFRPNVDAATWFAREVFPNIRQRLPEATFWVVGSHPVKEVKELAALPNVQVTGAVRDARPYIAGATAVVVPLRMGGGTKLKILEGAALARPLVVTSIGAEGYPVVHERDALVADTADALATACLSVANNPVRAAALGDNAYRNLAVPLEWRRVYARLEAVYARAIPD